MLMEAMVTMNKNKNSFIYLSFSQFKSLGCLHDKICDFPFLRCKFKSLENYDPCQSSNYMIHFLYTKADFKQSLGGIYYYLVHKAR